jgi:hypothetical protein
MNGRDIVDLLLDRRAYYAVIKRLNDEDKQSAELLAECMRHLVTKFNAVLDTNEEHGLARFQTLLNDGQRWDAALLRNNVFKVANAFGLRLPSSMFASAEPTLVEAWGPTLREW